MPIKKSAKKALRQTKKRTEINKKIKENFKKVVKKTKKEIAQKKKQEISKTLSEVYSILDKAAKRGVIHKNKASRIKARLIKELKKNFKEKIPLIKRNTSQIKNNLKKKSKNKK